MSATIHSSSQTLPLCIARVVGVTAPAIYASLTYAYSYLVMPPIASHAPPKLLAKQWLHVYQVGPRFVPPLIISGAISNAILAYFSPFFGLRMLYASAAVLTWSIMPVTLLYFEPKINGAGKWKVEQILRDEGFVMKENEARLPSVYRHTGTPAARKWAESVRMKEIAVEWARLNSGRYAVTAVATVLSAIATCTWGSGLSR